MDLEMTMPPPEEKVAPRRATAVRAYRHEPRKPSAEAPKVLLVAALFKLPYRVLRCAAQAGASVFVLGGSDARSLGHSKYCERFFDCRSRIDGRLNAELVLEINRLTSAYGIDLVAAADAPATRSLIAVSEVLEAPCFPMPELAAFDLLNNKWRFTQLCRELNITCPQSRLFADVEQLRAECRAGSLRFPIIAKPLSQDSGIGCVKVLNEKAVENLRAITYSPIIVQDFIPGADIGASMFCRDGEIEAFLVHDYTRAVYTAYDDPTLYVEMSRIARRLGLTGIFNFDMIMREDREVFFLECNPRVYYKMAMSMLAGINFLELGFPWRGDGEAPSFAKPVAVPFLKAMLRRPFDPAGWRALKFLADDPVPYMRDRLGFERGR